MNEPDNMNILMVDDSPTNISFASKTLIDNNFNLISAATGEEALKKIEENDFDLILLDIILPGIDGFEVCERLKSQKKTRNIPVIFLTSRSEPESIVKGFQLGGVDYITKPFKNDELLARVNAHITIQKQQKEYLEINANKDMFLSIIGHDIRGPLSSIISLTDLIIQYMELQDVDTLKKYTYKLKESTEETLKLLDHLVSWAASQREGIECNPMPHVLYEVVVDIVKLYAESAGQKGITIINKINPILKVQADIYMLMTIIRNLIGNAIKYSNKNGTISINADEIEGMHAEIYIEDQGIGMSDKTKHNLFKIDKKKSIDGTEGERGSGMGLIIAKEFVKQNGGKMHVTSKEGIGSIFSFTLPLA